MSYRFQEGESSARGARRIALEQIGKAVDRLEDASPESSLEEAIHDARKRIKKTRAILRLARGPIGKGRADRADRELREAARPLSEARDASVLLETFDSLASGEGQSSRLPGPITEARRLLASRLDEIARGGRAEGGPVAEAVSGLRSVLRRIGRWDPRGEGSGPASGLRRSYKRGRDALEDVLRDPVPEAFHQLRKRVKDLGDQIRALGTDPGDRASKFDELGRILGELHDLDVLSSALPKPGLGSIRSKIEERRRDLRSVALREAGPIFLEKPRAFAHQSIGANSSVGPKPGD